MFFTGKDHETNLLEIRTVLHQVHAASVMISIHMDTSLESLQHRSREYISCMLCITFLVSASPACSVIGEQVFPSCRDGQVFHSHRDDQVFHSCHDDGIRSSDCRVNSRHVL